MVTNSEKMKVMLEEMGLQLGGVSLGPEAVPDAVAEEILKSLQRLKEQGKLDQYLTVKN